MRNQAFLLSMVLVISACIGTGEIDPDNDAQARNQMVCETVTPTGSRLPKRVCRHQSDIDNDERVVRMLQDRMNRTGPIQENRPGGN